MYISRVVTGRIIEVRGDSVVTVQGDTVNTYNLRYYTLRDVEVEPEFVASPEPHPEPGGLRSRFRRWAREGAGAALLPWPLFWKKDANRI